MNEKDEQITPEPTINKSDSNEDTTLQGENTPSPSVDSMPLKQSNNPIDEVLDGLSKFVQDVQKMVNATINNLIDTDSCNDSLNKLTDYITSKKEETKDDPQRDATSGEMNEMRGLVSGISNAVNELVTGISKAIGGLIPGNSSGADMLEKNGSDLEGLCPPGNSKSFSPEYMAPPSAPENMPDGKTSSPTPAGPNLPPEAAEAAEAAESIPIVPI